MTNIVRSAVRRALPGAVPALCRSALTCAALAVLLAACGPEPAEIDRGPVAAAAGGGEDAGEAEIPADSRRLGSLALTGDPAYDGPAEVSCGPLPASGGHGGPAESEAVGRPEAVPAEDPGGEEESDPRGEGRTFELTLAAAEAPGLAVTLRLPDAGRGAQAPFVVASVAPDGTYRESSGTAEIALEDGAVLTRSSATDYLSGRFTGRYAGEAGSGEVEGRFERCHYFD
ncbi:MAG TPA: hypothetical protein VF100_01275 [Thermoanaerobaculia bacterium]